MTIEIALVNIFWWFSHWNLLQRIVDFLKFPKFIQLWGAVSPSSRNILRWDRYRCKDLCINFKLSLIRTKTGTWRESYNRYKIENFRKIAFTPPLVWKPVRGFHQVGPRYALVCFKNTKFAEQIIEIISRAFLRCSRPAISIVWVNVSYPQS